ncbi:glucose-methanol-choline oxidoreductase [Hypoxylon crocopeplum]|nr:glucose-methanol-choline oxidoreductase [Hypoxylon crocopeplum]
MFPWTYKKQREIVRRMDVYRGRLPSSIPRSPLGSKAACHDVERPLPNDVPDIEYTAEDDAVIDQWLRATVGTTWHSLGTCKMLLLEQNGVVNASLSVHGVTGLKIADMSIASRNVSAHINNMALIIGEKAAEIFMATRIADLILVR